MSAPRPVTAKTKVYAVLGDPVGHSLSPVLHNGWMAQAGLDAIYVALRLADAAALASAASWGFAGLNVTIPHKEAAARIANRRDPLVEALGAANTLRFEPDGAVSAFNTDAPGFLLGLDQAAPAWRKTARQALVLGAGGASRAIAHALAGAGCRVTLANRTLARAHEVAAKIGGAAVLPWDELAAGFAQADLIVNGASVGMSGTQSPDWPVALCANHAILADAVYRPLQTPLLAAAAARGLQTVDGLWMLIGQGALAFEIWFGIRPDLQEARTRLMDALAGETRG